ncbi:hypothetical protein ACH5RR_017235 [Cinchona calisaya]|uniref:protein-serine/threonine phosphatase n=1 Tax=Cinchona calisaya TaxID=153742 RepID=A0ABD2ZY67_9GENT
MIENLSHTSQSPETGCRATASSDSDTVINRVKCVQRRMRSLDKVKSELPVEDYEIITEEGRCLKKERKEGVVSDSFATSLANDQLKNDVVLEGTSSGSKAKENNRLPCWSHGSISVIGRRREMEDAVAVEVGFLSTRSGGLKEYDFFGVYDGHGGSSVAQACRDRLHKLVVERVEENDGNVDGVMIDWNKVMLESFKKMDEEVMYGNRAVVGTTTGSTAVVAVVGEEEVVVANCGDSRAVLSRGGIAIPLSCDHKPERPDELERIELSGGKVINWNGQRVLGVLATSRSLGDEYLKPFVISEPEVTVTKRSNTDEFLILGSDGLWDVISNDVACHVARKCLDGRIRRPPQGMSNSQKRLRNESGSASKMQADHHELGNESLAAEAASLLAELAIARGSRDNISVIVIQLKTSACCMAERVGNCQDEIRSQKDQNDGQPAI